MNIMVRHEQYKTTNLTTGIELLSDENEKSKKK
jgi:hypothetical protein